ncbi:MAG: hypothetical protein JKY03_12485, partial [Aureispira sp.]|nr:hypothetical protein [Aureispira sp.]
ILPAPIIVHLPRQIVPEPIIIYLDSFQKRVPISLVDTNKHTAAKLYKDSLEDENLTLYYESLVEGKLLNNVLNYKLKIPKQITKTIRINTPVPMPTNGLFLNAGVGGNVNTFSSLTVGLQFVSKKGWALGYDYDVLQNVHQVRLGVRLLPFKKVRR